MASESLLDLFNFVASDAPFAETRSASQVSLQAELEQQLTVAARGGQLTMHAVIPFEGNPTMRESADALDALETRITAALVLSLLPSERAANFDDLAGVVREYRGWFPTVVTSISLGSLNVTFNFNFGDAPERPKPRNWTKRVARALALIFATGTITVGGTGTSIPLLPPPHQAQQEIRRFIDKECRYLPPGSQITVNMGAVEIMVPCDGK